MSAFILARDMSDSPTAPMTDAMADLMKPTDEVKVETPGTSTILPTPESPKPKRENPVVADQEEKPVVNSPPAKKQKKKCGVCKKKLGLTGESFKIRDFLTWERMHNDYLKSNESSRTNIEFARIPACDRIWDNTESCLWLKLAY